MAQLQQIGKYYGLGIVGRGSTAIVYRGYDPFTDGQVAIKVSKSKLGKSPADRLIRKLFFNEAQTAGALVHSNIVRVLDAGEHEQSPYLVMEYVEGGHTLGQHCSPGERLPSQAVGEIVYHCAKALDYSHRHGVIHRDVKPNNILLSPEGKSKLTDFAVAQDNSADATQILGLIGSPRYMSPEQIRQQPLTPQTDVYSLGNVMYELLAGEPLFSSDNLASLMFKIVSEENAGFARLPSTVSDDVKEILRRALHKDPGQRFTTAGEMARAVSEVFCDIQTEETCIGEERKLKYLRNLEFFSEFSTDQLRQILHHGAWRAHAPGEKIIVEGTIDLAFYVVVAGHVVVKKDNTTIRRLNAGRCFGEMGYLSRAKRTATIVAGEPVILLALNSTVIKRTSTGCQMTFNEAFIRTLIERLANTSDALVEANKKSRLSAVY